MAEKKGVAISGFVKLGFEAVWTAFVENFVPEKLFDPLVGVKEIFLCQVSFVL